MAGINLVISFIFSFVGSIPPGTLNLTIIQLGLEHRLKIALRFAFAAAVVEYPYAWVAVKFHKLILSSPAITDNLELLTAIVMTALGLMNVLPVAKKPSPIKTHFQNSGFRRGLILGILNPLAIPYWIAITAYLQSRGWIDLSGQGPLHAYLFGVFAGAFTLLALLAYVSKMAMRTLADYPSVRRVPGLLLLALGMYSFARYLFD